MCRKWIICGIGKTVFKIIFGFILIPTACLSMGYSLYFYSCYIEPNWIRVDRVIIKDNTLSNRLKGITAVQISDLHISRFGFREKRLLSILNKINPDIIFITGDFITGKEDIPYCIDVIRHIKVRYGIWGVPGNCDTNDVKEIMEKNGINILTNEVKQFCLKGNMPFYLMGIDGRNIQEEIAMLVPKCHNAPILLLCHYPQSLPFASQSGIALILAGHTHGGQIGPLALRRLDRKMRGIKSDELVAGSYQMGNTQLYVNRGIGVHSLNIRFFCRPEITIFQTE
ncbi:metallophosphoesterase [Candidatus Desantisbacteria bacterium]|nr:metallophosphoesterase [Candidatus Desantisbacteria bacterium]